MPLTKLFDEVLPFIDLLELDELNAISNPNEELAWLQHKKAILDRTGWQPDPKNGPGGGPGVEQLQWAAKPEPTDELHVDELMDELENRS